MKRFVLAIALACALSGTALAGDIHTTGSPAPSSSACTGEIHTTGSPAPQASSPVVTVILTIISIVAG